ncbi:DNA polymerase III alpha subunit [Kitasatospora sp. MAP12-15]|uniref:OB-fold nucleic acid binding domain-containing protein n=1 Tax=unclassified Kitasatospora TaxID=2633591 RepID=UPI0024768B34|nr:OB-fold nucleic acid binding domain-containing protein [Kitasatospora sp. MAP12-44]MDH6107899.1 DNA polymerase III alpha subunit [Kitasatospora sp. MAP12-44]
MINAQPVCPPPAPTRQTIADLRTSGRIEGEVRLTGTITEARRHTNKSGNEWAGLTLTDTSGQIEVVVFPRTWRQLLDRDAVEVGRPVSVTGRINAPGRDLVQVYCHDLAPAHAQALPPQTTDPVTVQALIGRHAAALVDLAAVEERAPRTLAAFTTLVRDTASLLRDTRLDEAGGHLLAAGQYLRAIPAAADTRHQLLEFAAAHLAQAQDCADWPRGAAS